MARKNPTPAHDLDFALLSKVAFEAWPKEKFNQIEGVAECKLFYNKAYNILLGELSQVLNMFHPAAWIREAYIQLELWSVIQFKEHYDIDMGNVKGPRMFAAVGRYGWRYVLEICLERISDTRIATPKRPTKTYIDKVFTLLLALSHSSEYSNYLHYFSKNLSTVKIKLSPFIFTTHPIYDKKDELFFLSVINYIAQKPNWESYKNFYIDSDPKIMKMIDDMLLYHFGFILEDVHNLINVFVNIISPKIGASVLVTAYEEAISMFSELTLLEAKKVKKILDFILLDTKSKTYNKRDFLVRSQVERMLNYSGAIVYLNNNLKTIYSNEASTYDFIVASNKHILLTATLVAEWVDTFISRLVFGQRTDLKLINEELNKQISWIEEYFHKNIFENQLKKMMERKGFSCLSIDKVNGETISCGEIDIVGYNKLQKKLLIVEAKNHAPAKDARSMGKVISDHFRQKKYHAKFLSKISWVIDNRKIVNEIFRQRYQIELSADCEVNSYFITGSSNAVKFLISDYKVLTFYEFDKTLSDE